MGLFLSDLYDQVLSIFRFFFNGTATTEIYTYLHTLSLHDALPILGEDGHTASWPPGDPVVDVKDADVAVVGPFNGYRRMTLTPPPVAVEGPDDRSEEHTSELQSLMRISYAVFCLKKKQTNNIHTHTTT